MEASYWSRDSRQDFGYPLKDTTSADRNETELVGRRYCMLCSVRSQARYEARKIYGLRKRVESYAGGGQAITPTARVSRGDWRN
ncbi:hypothetical protein PsYK624_162520 [Phanerochaete sordida]|uniref:Uncharacterized protein n=1 Tax=Phanerochaete sordida TaxID=48140 RepID=A0A9P3GV85_9APHY|nr:hypothetical protein PsYK624_162520 [Phanerochaete sordida]